MTVGSLKQVYDGVFNSNPTTIRKLQWILEVACLLIQVDQSKSLQDFQDSGADTIWTCSLVPVQSLQLFLHLTVRDRHVFFHFVK